MVQTLSSGDTLPAVASYTDSNSDGRTARLEDGGYISVWLDWSGRVRSQRYDAAGQPAGPGLDVSSEAGNRMPVVIGLGDGGYLISWSATFSLDGRDGLDVLAQRYDAGGMSVGDVVVVNTTRLHDQTSSSLTQLANGDIVIAWVSLQQGRYTVDATVSFQRFSSTGALLGTETYVGVEGLAWTVQGNPVVPKVTALSNGGFVITWSTQVHGEDDRFDVAARAYNASGEAVGAVFTANSTTARDQFLPQVASVADGGYVLVWEAGNWNMGGLGSDLYGQRFADDGSKIGAEFHVTQVGGAGIYSFDIAVFDDGSFVVVWAYHDGIAAGVSAQFYNSSGDAMGTPLQLADPPSSADVTLRNLDVTALNDGAFAVTWDRWYQDIAVETRVYGLGGNVILHGDASSETLSGASGDDVLAGAGGADRLLGGDGDDRLDGGLGADRMLGGLGDDTYYVDNLADSVGENHLEGNDIIISSVSYSLFGRAVESLTLTGTGNVNATGNSLTNTLIGTSGNNVLDGGTGGDLMVGGLGDDTYYVDNIGDSVRELHHQGTDTVFSSVSYSLFGRAVEVMTLTGAGNLNATGNSLNNTLTGTSGNNVLDGGVGADKMVGGLGDDTYYVDHVHDNVAELHLQGTDTVFSSVTYSFFGRAAEILNLTGTANINATGNSLANTLTGNASNNVLDGAGGNDILTGGLGSDIFLFTAASGKDTVTDFSAAQNDLLNVNAYTGGVANAATVSQVGADTVINLGGGNIITVLSATQAEVLSHIVW